MTVTPHIPESTVGAAQRLSTQFGPLWFRSDDHVMRPAVKSSGVWEPGETAVLQQLIRPGMRFLDIGAHIGYFSAVAHASASNVRVDAVEPDPFTSRLCDLNLFALNVDARVWGCGLGAQREALGLSIGENNPGDSRLVEAMESSLIVPVLPGDELFHDEVFDVVKIDVQGYEVEAMLGLRRTLRRSRHVTVLVEFFPQALVESGRRPRDVLSTYRSWGFTIHTLIGDRVVELPDDEVLSTCAAAGVNGFVTLLLKSGS